MGRMVRARAKMVVEAGDRGDVFEGLCAGELFILGRLKAGRKDERTEKSSPATRV